MDGLIWLRAQWDNIAGWALIAVASVLVVIAATQARYGLFTADQLSYLATGGLGGLACAAVGARLLISARLHDEWRRLDRLESSITTGGSSTASYPWAKLARAHRDRVVGWILVVTGVALVLVTSRSVRLSVYPPDQVTYIISGGLIALLFVSAGAVVLVRADTRDIRQKLARLHAAPQGQRLLPARDGRRGVGGAVAFLAGAACFALGWHRAAHAVALDPALDGLAIAVAGVALLLAAAAATAVRSGRDLDRCTREVLGPLAAPEVTITEVPRADLWTAPGLARYHHGACPALTGAGGQPWPVSADDATLEPCLLCAVEVGA